jgi:hypothetical protein
VLTEFSGRDNDLCVGDVIVGEEDYFEQTFCLAVVVDNCSYLVDQFDDMFGSDIGRCSLSCKHDCSGYYLFAIFGVHFLDGEVAVYNVEDVHELPFVFVYPFHVYIEE